MKPLRVGLVGAGRMGRLHARVYSELPDVQLIGLVDIDSARLASLAQRYGTRSFTNPQQLVGQVQAVSIASPTDTHLQIAGLFLAQGIPALIEKPLAPSAEQAEQLVSLAQRHNTFIQVGHSERFNPAVRALDGYDLSPRFIEVVRVSPFPFRSMDVGVVLDMMIHDIDLVLHFVGSEPVAIDAVGAGVLAEHEDLANVRLRFANGCVANLSCSRLALATQRTFRIFSDDLYISLDLHAKAGFVVDKFQNTDRIKQALTKVNGPAPDWTQLVQATPLVLDDAEPMRLQLENFTNCVRTGAAPVVSGSDGAAAVSVAEAIVEAIKTHSQAN
ncbi:MAG: Gfo/Idh/MocA family oxidoreductase [Actinobacteria bacterium]|nr:Gfo/Idh/MocA family oxidoreductase [Actinomycetota bacterium]